MCVCVGGGGGGGGGGGVQCMIGRESDFASHANASLDSM